MKVEIWSDVVCPWCYIGKTRFDRALANFADRDQVDVVYRSFQLDPSIPAGETRDVVADLARRKGTSEGQIRALMESVERTAAADGLELHLPDAKTGNTVDAHRVIHLAADAGRQRELVDRLYRAHFTELRSVFDRASLTPLATDAYRDRVAADERMARALGITGVPFYVVGGKYGVSGAQPTEVFAEVLERAWSESQPLETVAGDGAVCEDGLCY